MSGTKKAAAPTAPTAPVAMYKKSRRVCSAEDTVVTSEPSPPGSRIIHPRLEPGTFHESPLAAGRTVAAALPERQDGALVAFIGTLAVLAQARYRRRAHWSHKSFV